MTLDRVAIGMLLLVCLFWGIVLFQAMQQMRVVVP